MSRRARVRRFLEERVRDVAEVAGAACVVAAGFILHPALGLLILAGFLFAGVYLTAPLQEKTEENDGIDR